MIVIDSSSLILLAKTNALDILIKNIKKSLAIPEQVYAECTARKELFDAQIIEKRIKEKAIAKKSISNQRLCNKIQQDFNLGKGEAEAICLGIELKLGIITDDKKAINACRILKIRFTTMPKLIVQLYKKKLIGKAELDSALTKLQKFGRYSDEIMQKLKEDIK